MRRSSSASCSCTRTRRAPPVDANVLRPVTFVLAQHGHRCAAWVACRGIWWAEGHATALMCLRPANSMCRSRSNTATCCSLSVLDLLRTLRRIVAPCRSWSSCGRCGWGRAPRRGRPRRRTTTSGPPSVGGARRPPPAATSALRCACLAALLLLQWFRRSWARTGLTRQFSTGIATAIALLTQCRVV